MNKQIESRHVQDSSGAEFFYEILIPDLILFVLGLVTSLIILSLIFKSFS